MTRAGLEHVPFDDVPAAVMGPVFARLPSMTPEEANATVVRDVFGRLDAGEHDDVPVALALARAWSGCEDVVEAQHADRREEDQQRAERARGVRRSSTARSSM